MNAKIQNWKDWYFEGKYHCDQCPYSWEDCGYRYVQGRECNAGNASLQGTLYPNSSCIRVQNRGEIYPAGKVGRKILAEVWNTRKEIAYGKEKI